jgi:hypothetical protein
MTTFFIGLACSQAEGSKSHPLGVIAWRKWEEKRKTKPQLSLTHQAEMPD